MTQVEVASALGVHSLTVTRWESGKLRPKGEALVDLARLYGVPVDAFMAGDARPLNETVPRGTSDNDSWAPSPVMRGVVPERVYDVAISYCRRLAAAGVPREEVEEAERLLIDPAYAKLNRRAKREITEDEQIQIIDATWSVMQEVLSWKGVRA